MRNGQDLRIVSKALAVGGVGGWKFWCLVVSGGWVEGHAVLGRSGKMCWRLGERCCSWVTLEDRDMESTCDYFRRAKELKETLGKRGDWGSSDERSCTDGR